MFTGFHATDLIVKKRDGGEHTPAELEWLVRGVVDGSIPDYQLAAWLMAVVWRGMTDGETVALTQAMARSGTVLDLAELPGPVVDKHSTGGVGDKTSLVVGPLAAATGLTVAKMSGRGLGHTGGTLDKLESIPGFTVDLDIQRFCRQAADIGLVIAGQTADLAPADGKLYALRDVTGTVPSLPLIAASIMSKKIASGAPAIALDVKVGAGAFLPTTDAMRELAETMVQIGRLSGLRVAAVLTSMEQPLGRTVGNALEVKEAVATLKGEGPPDFTELSLVTAALMHSVAQDGPVDRHAKGARLAQGAGDSQDNFDESVRPRLEAALRSGAAFEKFRDMVQAQGGDPRVIDDTSRLPSTSEVWDVVSDRSGHVQAVNARVIGDASVALGAGRVRKGEPIDPAVGIVLHARIGDHIDSGAPLATVHARSAEAAAQAESRICEAFRIGDAEASPPDLVLGYVR